MMSKQHEKTMQSTDMGELGSNCCLACTRPWVPSPAPEGEREKERDREETDDR
jgi:hypothetical protein